MVWNKFVILFDSAVFSCIINFRTEKVRKGICFKRKKKWLSLCDMIKGRWYNREWAKSAHMVISHPVTWYNQTPKFDWFSSVNRFNNYLFIFIFTSNKSFILFSSFLLIIFSFAIMELRYIVLVIHTHIYACIK